ncbi:hypothetical protein K491DRAFT_104963 [Lophiostoma macrostomum CBS 122681]|uniref:Uncharacterized protein n=1 Tax=Lophiostoma macrostomum CBS 122681 TaxID=1314788 RepID=A0A6A6SU15_9PLEO|nr:hypothetical protein K491DRAFT_104963 [Lophiostoma macrostomum CBS 122681]
MDPLSITVNVLSIMTTCIKSAKTLSDIQSAWKRAPATVSSLTSSLKLTSVSLSQIQCLILENDDIFKNDHDIMSAFDTTLTASNTISVWLEKIMTTVTMDILSVDRIRWKTRFKIVWNESEIKDLLVQLGNQQNAANLLINLLQMGSMAKIKDMLRNQQTLMTQIAKDTMAIRATRAPEAPESIFTTNTCGASILDRLTPPNAIGVATQSSFEAEILSSGVYMNTFTRTLSPSVGNESTDDRNTANSIDISNTVLDDDKQLQRRMPQINDQEAMTDPYIPSTSSPVHLRSANDEHVSSVPKLSLEKFVDVSESDKIASQGYTPQRREEVGFERNDTAANLQFNDVRSEYQLQDSTLKSKDQMSVWNSRVENGIDNLEPINAFDMKLSRFPFLLRREVKVVAKENMLSNDPNVIQAKKGSEIIVVEIDQSYEWHGMCGQSRGGFDMTQVSMDDHARMTFDHILEKHMVRTMSRLNKKVIKKECEAIYIAAEIANEWFAEEPYSRRKSLYRQCGSVKELALVTVSLHVVRDKFFQRYSWLRT